MRDTPLMDTPKRALQRLILQQRDIGPDELDAALREQGVKFSMFTLTTLRSDFRYALATIESEGWLRHSPRPRKRTNGAHVDDAMPPEELSPQIGGDTRSSKRVPPRRKKKRPRTYHWIDRDDQA